MSITKYINTIGRVFRMEMRTIFRDAGAVLLFLIANIAYPMVYSIVYSNEDLKDIPTCIVDLDNTPTSRLLAKYIDETPELKIIGSAASLNEGKEMYHKGQANTVVAIPKDFEKKILKAESSPVSLYCDGAYFLYYKMSQMALLNASRTLGAQVEVKKLLAKGETIEQAKTSLFPMNISVFEKYNPAGGYGSFIMPGIIFLILQQTLLIGIGLLGGTMRERNSFGHYRAFALKRGGVSSLIMGKALAYSTFYVFNFILSLVIMNDIFNFPFKGVFIDEILLLIPYLFAISFLGLAISTLFKTRVHSLMFLVFMSPILLFFTGLSWPKECIPEVLQWISALFPSEFGVPAFLRLRVMGVAFDNISREFCFIVIQMVVYFVLACIAYKRAIFKK